jgi:hypothetical protein
VGAAEKLFPRAFPSWENYNLGPWGIFSIGAFWADFKPLLVLPFFYWVGALGPLWARDPPPLSFPPARNKTGVTAMQRRENAVLGLACRAKIIAPRSARVIAPCSTRRMQHPHDAVPRQHHTAALLALASLALLVKALASCVSQEHTSRPGNLALAAGQFTVSKMVTFVAFVRKFPAIVF